MTHSESATNDCLHEEVVVATIDECRDTHKDDEDTEDEDTETIVEEPVVDFITSSPSNDVSAIGVKAIGPLANEH